MEKRMAALFWFFVFIKIKSKTKIRNSEWQFAFLSCTNPLSLHPMDSEKDFIQKSEIVASGSSKWEAPSNIALVKYWGKFGAQYPQNPSLSFTLSQCVTQTLVAYKPKENQPSKFSFDFTFEGEPTPSFHPKIEVFLERIAPYVPFIQQHHLTIESSNSFPHSSGIASSASGMSALALGIMSIEKAGNPTMSEAYFLKKASFLARLGSGSAARSIQGPMVSWGVSDVIEGSSDLYGTPLSSELHPVFQDFQDTILLIDKGQKKVSSTLGHNLMKNHPYAATRFEQARTNIKDLKIILASGDLPAFIALVESEALTLHALMMASQPYFILMHPNTLQVLNKVWAYREETQSSLCFTLDAGANVHLLYPKSEKSTVLKFIKEELAGYCQKNQFIEDQIGNGAKKL